MNIGNKPEESVLIGWDEISEYADVSVRQVMNYEKKGMQVHRSPRGKASRVWAFTSDVESFLLEFEEIIGKTALQVNDVTGDMVPERSVDSDNSKKKGYYQFRVVVPIIFLASVTIIVILFWLSAVLKYSPGRLSYQLEKNSEGIIQKGYVVDGKGEKIRELFQVQPGFDKIGSEELEFMGIPQFVALNCEGGDSNILVEVLDEYPKIHRKSGVIRLDFDDLMVTTQLGLEINDFVWDRVKWVNSMSFKGWAFLLSSVDEFPGVLILFTPNFKEVGRLYHPGRLMEFFAVDDYFYINGHLNAREVIRSGYCPMIFKISISKIMGKRVQVNPFSSSTLTPSRLAYYCLKEIEIVATDRYLAFPISKNYGEYFKVYRGEIQYCWDFFLVDSLVLVFDKDLKLMEKRFNEHEFLGNLHAQDQDTRFKIWQGKDWSEWREGAFFSR